jgi:hypothetical protein
VWNSFGEEILAFPRSKDECVVGSLGHWISPDGAYTITSCERRGGFPRSIIVDIKNRKIWQATALIDVLRIKRKYVIGVQETDEKLGRLKKEIDLEGLAWVPLQ